MARKIIRRRKVSLNSVLGVTKAKRDFARATGIPATKTGRKRKAINTLTGGAYGKYERMRADSNRPYKTVKRAVKGSKSAGCLVWAVLLTLLAVSVFSVL